MNHKEHYKFIFFAALLTVLFSYILDELNFVGRIFDGSNSIAIIVAFFLSMIMGIIAGLPAWFFLKEKNIPHALAIVVFATIEAYWLSYSLMPVFSSAENRFGWVLFYYLFIVIFFILGDQLFNKWHSRFRYKVLLAIIFVVTTVLLRAL